MSDLPYLESLIPRGGPGIATLTQPRATSCSHFALTWAALLTPGSTRLAMCALAFNNSEFPSLPWRGFTLDWFTSTGPQQVGIFEDSDNLRAIWTSFQTAVWVSVFCVVVGVCAAFLFEQENFPGKELLYFLMLAPLVIPGVILGISILLGANTIGTYFEDHWGLDFDLFRPSFQLVVLGQFSFITTFVTLVVSSRLRKFDHSLEKAALNLGATRFEVIWHITLRYLRSSIIGAGAVAFLMSFENFNTTLFLVGSHPTLPINLYLQVRDGSTPVINAISLLLILGSFVLTLTQLYLDRHPSSSMDTANTPPTPPAPVTIKQKK